jgi:medium-chain acyl-[acyl-carrier-protein] hydrolase
MNSLWLVTPKPNPSAQLRLFCFPFAGGGASLFRLWPAGLPAFVELCAIQLPGREGRIREAPQTNLASLIKTLSEVLAPSLDKPFAFFGHSMGARISFELARHLRKEQKEPELLIVSGRRAPQIPEAEPLMHNLPEEQFRQHLRGFGGTPEVILNDPEMMALFSPILRADFTLNEATTYQKEEPLTCPIVAFGGHQDHRTTHSQLLAWQEQTTSQFSHEMFSGGHFFIQTERAQVLQVLGRYLEALRKS